MRVLDTRNGTGTGGTVAPVGRRRASAVQIAGVDGIPADATAVALNLTLTDATGYGNIAATPAAAPADHLEPELHRRADRRELAIVPLGADGKIYLTKQGPGTVDLIADVTGYFSPDGRPTATAGRPDRVLDTRNGTGAPRRR